MYFSCSTLIIDHHLGFQTIPVPAEGRLGVDAGHCQGVQGGGQQELAQECQELERRERADVGTAVSSESKQCSQASSTACILERNIVKIKETMHPVI
jgi:hypothetical protein